MGSQTRVRKKPIKHKGRQYRGRWSKIPGLVAFVLDGTVLACVSLSWLWGKSASH